MFPLFRRNVDRQASPIGIDLGGHRVKLVQVERARPDRDPGTWRVTASAAAEVPDGTWADPASRRAFFAGTVRRLVDGGGFRGRRAALALPAAATFVTGLRLPPLPPNGLHAAVVHALAGSLPYPVGLAVVKHVVAGDAYERSERKTAVVAMAVRRALIEDCLAAVAAARLELVSVTPEPVALVAALSRMSFTAAPPPPAHGTRLIVDLCSSAARVYASRDGRLVFARRLDVPGPGRTSRLAGDTSTDAALRHLAGELVMCRNYLEACQGGSVVDAVFTGGRARCRQTCERLAAAIGVPGHVAAPVPSQGGASGPEWTVALGASLTASIKAGAVRADVAA